MIANGCVVDPRILLEEIENLRNLNKKVDLKLSSTAHVIFPFHVALDGLEEKSKGDLSAGTTKRGIGPTYADKAARWGIRIFDLINPNLLWKKLERLFEIKKKLIHAYDPNWEGNLDEIYKQYKEYGERLKQYVTDTAFYLNQAIDSGKKVVFEGAQGNLLGIDHGMYPFGTSSNPNILGICAGTGVPPKKIRTNLGIVKAYTSRVGEGTIPTELFNTTAEKIREQGHEYGTVTGRPRRVGWIDLFNIKYGIMINGIDKIAITLLDALQGIDLVKMCIGYEFKGVTLESWPIHHEIIKDCIPIYKEFAGWEGKTSDEWSNVAEIGFEALPATMKDYINAIKDELKIEIAMISIGPKRNDTILLNTEFF